MKCTMSRCTLHGTSTPVAYINGWGADSEMICTDCHSNDTSGSPATGPHGSIYNYMLKEQFVAEVGATNNTGRPGTQYHLCFGCHDAATYLTGDEQNDQNTNFFGDGRNLHIVHIDEDAESPGCFACHPAVIHGSYRKHLIVYEADGAPYYKARPNEGLVGWRHNGNRNYSNEDCQANCHPSEHGSSVTGAEP